MAHDSFTLTGTYQLFDGTPARGIVEIIPSEKVVKDTTGNVVLSGRVKVELDAAGAFSVSLPDPRDTTNLNPAGFGYTVSAKLYHQHLAAVSFGGDQITASAVAGVLNIEDVTSVDPSTFTPGTTYVDAATYTAGLAGTVPNTRTVNGHALSGDVTVSKGDVGLGSVPNVDATERANHTGTQTASTISDLTESVQAQVISSKDHAFDDLTGSSDGALTSAHVTRSGHAVTLFNLGGSDYSVSGGALVHTINAGTTAAYLGVQVPNPVRHFHAEAEWTNNGQASEEFLALIVSGSQFTVAGFADAGAHVLFYRDHWTYQTYQAGMGPTNRATGTYKTLPFDQWHRFAVTWDGYAPTLYFPDGTSAQVPANAAITAGWGPHATVESYSTGNQNPIAVRAFSATSEVSLPTTPQLVDAGKHAKSPTAASTGITGGFTVVDTLSITVPASRLLAVVAHEYVDTGGATGNLYSQVDVDGNGTSTQYQLLSSGVALNRSVPIIAVIDLSDFTPGTTQTLNIRLLCDAVGTVHRVNSGEHRRQVIIAVPLGSATF